MQDAQPLNCLMTRAMELSNRSLFIYFTTTSVACFIGARWGLFMLKVIG